MLEVELKLGELVVEVLATGAVEWLAAGQLLIELAHDSIVLTSVL